MSYNPKFAIPMYSYGDGRVASFPRYGRRRNITEIENKTINMENRGNSVFANQKQKYPPIIVFIKIFSS